MKRIRVAISGFHDGNAGQVAEWFEEVTGMEIACFFSAQEPAPAIDVAAENKKRVSQRLEYPGADSFKGRRLIWKKNWPAELKKMGIRHVLPMDSANHERWLTVKMCREHGLNLISAIHPTALVLPQAVIAPGVWINAKAVIGYKTELSSGVIVNTGSILEHHNVLESCVQVDPAVTTTGNVTLRARCHVHTGAILLNHVVVGEDAEVGAGTLVRHEVEKGCVVVGVPARLLRKRNLETIGLQSIRKSS